MNGIKKTELVLGFLLLMIILSNASIVSAAEKSSAKQAGKTLLTRASVTSKRASGIVTLKRRSAIFEKDEIRVGKDGRAQFRMIDQALISVQENSVLQIQNYQYQSGGKNNSALLELLSGGLRTITGAIGKGNKKAYELRTPLATIGIRGTDYEVEIVPSGMYVAVWDGIIHLRARLKNGCNMLIGRSQPYMFVFIDRLGKCKGLPQVPDVFATGHSSNVAPPQRRNNVAGRTLRSRPLVLQPLVQSVPNPTNPTTFDYNAFNINQNNPSAEVAAKSTTFDSNDPTFKVGLDLINNTAGVPVSDFTQSVGGFPVSWGYWGDSTTTVASKDKNSSGSTQPNGIVWATYQSTNPNIVSTKTGSFTYDNMIDSLIKGGGSGASVNNLQIGMDVNFDTGNVTNGTLSANTTSDTWIAVFDGKIENGDLDLDLNGASVVDSDTSTASLPRDVSGFIAGDFVGDNAEAIVGAFGLSEDNNSANHIEGVFVVGEEVQTDGSQ
jgi:hypothetical protein